VTTTLLTPEDMKDAFIVMGTDGLWEKLTNEQVVGLVGKWLDQQQQTGPPRSSLSGWLTGRSGDTFDVIVDNTELKGTKKPSRKSGNWVWQDVNAATHLIRNALGGGDMDEVGLRGIHVNLGLWDSVPSVPVRKIIS